MLNEDYKDILRLLSEEKARFLIVGAYAMGIYGYPRATGDIDIWVEPDRKNSERVFKALTRFGSPLKDVTVATFTEEGIIFQIGLAPRRIDLITSIDGVDFQKAYKNKKIVSLENLRLPFLSLSDLILNKKSTRRPKDLLDIQNLKKTKD